MSEKPGDLTHEDTAKIFRLMDDAITDTFDRIENIRRGRYTTDKVARLLDKDWDLGDMYREWIEEGEE